MYRLILLSLVILLSNELSAQRIKDVFPLNREFKRGGLFIEPQATISFGNKDENDFQSSDSLYKYTEEGRGKFGYGLEVGWFHSYKNPMLIHYIEFAAAYRFLQGEARHEGTLNHLGGMHSFESKNNFKNQYLTASFRATNATQLGDFTYLSTSLGLNYNYLLSSKYDREIAHPAFEEKFHDEHSLQLHLKIGVGFRLSRQLVAVPSIETPLLSLLPTDNFNPALPFYHTKYHPVYIGIKFMFLRDDPLNCNAPTYNGPLN